MNWILPKPIFFPKIQSDIITNSMNTSEKQILKKKFQKKVFLRNLGEFHVLIEKFRINEKIVISWKEETAVWEQDEMLKGFEKPQANLKQL